MITIKHLFEDIVPCAAAVMRIEESLNVALPREYIRFIESHGAIDGEDLSIYGSWKGDRGEDIPSVIGYTKILRTTINLPENYIVIHSVGNDEILLDTENGYLYQWHDDMKKILPIMDIDSFSEFLKSKSVGLCVKDK